jgi:hypothetical protein
MSVDPHDVPWSSQAFDVPGAPRGPLGWAATLVAILGFLLGLGVAITAVVYYFKFPHKPDAVPVKDLWLLVGFEIVVVSAGLAWVFHSLAGKRVVHRTSPSPALPQGGGST